MVLSQDNKSSVLQIITGDVFGLTADALVFPANHKPIIGGILDGQVYEKADQASLLADREKIGYLHGGETAITESHGVPGYKYLIHAAVPVYKSGHSSDKLKSCYVNALMSADSNRLKSVVFCLLGTGYSRFTEDWAEKCARKAIESFLDEHPDTTIKSIQLVKFADQRKYKKSIKALNVLKGLDADALVDIDLNPESKIGKRKKKLDDRIKQQLDTQRKTLAELYYSEQKAFVEQHATEYDDAYDEFNDLKYLEIVGAAKKDTSKTQLTNAELAEEIYMTVKKDTAKNGRANDISKIRNLRSAKGVKYKNAYIFLSKKINVLRLCLGLQLDLDDTSLLMLTRGHFFPSTDFDYEIAEYYIKSHKWFEALADYEEEFSGKSGNDSSPDIEKE